ncbi:MAG: DNA photolyase, partial [Rhodobacteraceae bacterium]
MTDTAFPPSRNAALERLAAFVPQAGEDYARRRNFDLGPGRHAHVSTLSPYIRHRLITEQEVLQAVLGRHSLRAAEKFVQEVFWRTYWKGWLELRPGIWTAYKAERDAAWNAVQTQSGLRTRWEEACLGRTGIEAFDHWARELTQTGYLHNHARMWFASIWIFTLRLPWTLGADVFLRHLLDGDPASNTLSWRWVAGLHTAGKAYLADAARIHAMTGGRFSPDGLARHAVIPEDSIAVPPATPPRPHRRPGPAEPALLLVTPEDLSLETESAIARLDIRAIAALPPTTAPDRRAMADALDRAGAHWGLLPAECADLPDIVDLARRSGARQIVTGY